MAVLPFVIEQGFCARGAQPPCQGRCGESPSFLTLIAGWLSRGSGAGFSLSGLRKLRVKDARNHLTEPHHLG